MLIEAHSKGEGVQDAIHEALARGEHEIVFGTGLHRVTKQISLVDVKHLSIRGMPGAVLQLAPLAFALTETPAKAGETRILVQKIRGLESVTHLRIFAPGKMHPYTGAPAHLFSAALDRADGKVLVLKEPLPFPVPAGTLIVDEHGPNMFDLRGVCEDISIEGLVLDGGRLPDEPVYSAHEQRSILFAHGHYGYEEGPIG
ncbi:MAG: hypothetical protein JNM63_13340, partial [Spirochaetia bacterium]|nr:hypothetical protein [Spirochaetia bacterium]